MKKILGLIALLALVSCAGPKGDTGATGATGAEGKSAYQIWLDLGNTGTEADFISFLEGADGQDGIDYASLGDKVSDFAAVIANQFDTVSVDVMSVVKGFTAMSMHQYVVVATMNNGVVTYNVYDLRNYNMETNTGYHKAWQLEKVNDDFYRFYASGKYYYLSQDTESVKDLESLADTLETYGLSTARAQKLSRLAKSYQKLSKSRGLTNSEKDRFSKEVLGMSFDEASTQMVESYDSRVEDAANFNETSPEAIKELLDKNKSNILTAALSCYLQAPLKPQ